MKDYYKILEIEPNATLEQIKSQHRFLLHAWHPDKFPSGELKDKANDKVREINEAYSILSDSVKRANYDKLVRSYSTTSTQEAQSQSSKNPQSAPPKEYCQSCGLPVQTKYVEFYENVGMIFMRQHRNVKGNFCKSCIDYYFWNLTGKTMLLGWWGMISFIVTPFILLNNFFRFIFTMGMKKFPLSVTPNPTPFWVFTTIGGVAIGGFLLFSMFCSVLSLPLSSYALSPTSTPIRPLPTPKNTIVPIVTDTSPECLHWSTITPNMEGQNVCVYGTVYSFYETENSWTRIKFSNLYDTFFIEDIFYSYPDLRPGDCVQAFGTIRLYGKIPHMQINGELYECP